MPLFDLTTNAAKQKISNSKNTKKQIISLLTFVLPLEMGCISQYVIQAVKNKISSQM